MLLLMLLKGCHVIISLFCLYCFWEDIAVVYFPQEGLYANVTSVKDDLLSI